MKAMTIPGSFERLTDFLGNTFTLGHEALSSRAEAWYVLVTGPSRVTLKPEGLFLVRGAGAGADLGLNGMVNKKLEAHTEYNILVGLVQGNG